MPSSVDRVDTHGESKKLCVSPITASCAAVLAVLCAVPLVFWGNPYPPRIFSYWLGGTAAALAVAALTVLFPAFKLSRPLQLVIDWIARLPETIFSIGIACFASLLGAFFAIATFKRGASTTDELAQRFHAKILLSGRWYLPVDINREFFALDTVVDVGHWYSQFPIGGPLLLAFGELFGAPWIVNPILMGVATFAIYQFVRRTYGDPVGRTTAIVFATAPSIVIMSGTMMNHIPTLCLATIALTLLAAWHQSESRYRSMLLAGAIGVSMGLMATLRPLDAVVFASVTGVFQLFVFRIMPRRIIEWLPQTIGGVLGASPVLVANAATTGSPFRFAYEVNWGAGHGLGFHADPYGNAFTAGMGLEHIVTYVSELNMFVTAWPVPVVLLVIASLLLIRNATKWDALLLGLFFAQLFVHGAYWGRGEFLGPRFLFTAMPTLVVFVARLPHLLKDRLQWNSSAGSDARTSVRQLGFQPALITFFSALFAITWLVPQLPLNAWGLSRIARDARKNLRIDVDRAVAEAGVHNALVFLREPFSARVTRRLWGAGLSRSESAILLKQKDGCSIFAALNSAQALDDKEQARDLIRNAANYTAGNLSMESSDGVLSLTSPQSLTPERKAEFDSDALGGFVPFGVGLVADSIDSSGRISGDVIFVADLGHANEALRERFGNRTWYRLSASPSRDGAIQSQLAPYRELTPGPPP